MKSILLLFVVGMSTVVSAQKFVAEKSYVSFFSKATIEDIKAENSKSQSIFNAATGEIVFSIPIKDFEFAKSLMKEHFNEKYMDTEQYPKSTFQGKLSVFDMKGTGPQQSSAAGKLTIHGVTQDVTIPGTFEIVNGSPVMKAVFIVKLETYKVNRPQLLWQNIAEQVEVTVEFKYKPQ